MPDVIYLWKGRIVSRSAYYSVLLFHIIWKVAVVSATLRCNSLQRSRTTTSEQLANRVKVINTLLLISPERCSECKCNFATLFLKAEIISVQILKLGTIFLHVFHPL
jgi:hypothetical protein